MLDIWPKDINLRNITEKHVIFIEYTRFDFVYSSQNTTDISLSEQSVLLKLTKSNISLQQMAYIYRLKKNLKIESGFMIQ